MIDRQQAKRCVGKGWHGLIDEFYDKFPEADMIQVKEKYGALCLYHNNSTDESTDLELDIMEESLFICEECGDDGCRIEINHWVYTLCTKHGQEKNDTKQNIKRETD